MRPTSLLNRVLLFEYLRARGEKVARAMQRFRHRGLEAGDDQVHIPYTAGADKDGPRGSC